MTSSYITTNFSSESTSSDLSAELELDGEYHVSLYGIEKISFSINELVYLKVRPIYSVEPYTIQISSGSCKKVNQGNVEEIVEYLSFKNTTSASLSYMPIGCISTEWSAGSAGSVLISGNVITIPSSALAILKCTYEIEFDRLCLTAPSNLSDEEILVMVGSDLYGYADISVDYSGGIGIITDITLTIKDVMSDDIIPDATIELSKEGIVLFTGTSNAEGEITIQGICSTGETYDIKTTATSYFDSDVDYLNNDSFTVPVD